MATDDTNRRVDAIMKYLSSDGFDDLPDDIKFKYDDGWDPDRLDEELQNHPFFMTKFPEGDEPVPPLLEAFQQLKYSEEENSNHELSISHKQDGVFHFKLKKYRIAGMCFTTAINYENQAETPDVNLLAQLYNNRSACMMFLGNFRSCIRDCEKALSYDDRYAKVLKRGIDAALEIRDFDCLDKLFSLADNIEELDPVVISARVTMKKLQSTEKKRERAEAHNAKVKDQEHAKLLELIQSRGIKLSNNEFYKSEAAAGNGKVVKIGEDGYLNWPVLFLYPQFNVTDFVEEFNETVTFNEQLAEVLSDRPSWDVDGEYRLEYVEVYYTSDGKLTPVDLSSSLGKIMSTPPYVLPSNGVPGFIVVTDNEFCKVFKSNAQ